MLLRSSDTLNVDRYELSFKDKENGQEILRIKYLKHYSYYNSH